MTLDAMQFLSFKTSTLISIINLRPFKPLWKYVHCRDVKHVFVICMRVSLLLIFLDANILLLNLLVKNFIMTAVHSIASVFIYFILYVC